MPFCQKCGKEADFDEDFCPSCGFSLKGLPYYSDWIVHREYHEKRITCPHCPQSSEVYTDPTKHYLSKKTIEREFIRKIPTLERGRRLAGEEQKMKEERRKRRKEDLRKFQESIVRGMLSTPEPVTSYMWSDELQDAFQRERQAESACLEAISRYGSRRIRTCFHAIDGARQARHALEFKETGRIDGHKPKISADDRRKIEFQATGKIDGKKPHWRTLQRLRLGKYAPLSGRELDEWLSDFAGGTSAGSSVRQLKSRWLGGRSTP